MKFENFKPRGGPWGVCYQSIFQNATARRFTRKWIKILQIEQNKHTDCGFSRKEEKGLTIECKDDTNK